ncbi:DNA methyltransferase [Tissierella praeacuta]|uniref:DNA methyltransferase n=1 Tax=Tissierella praeacuta TaxID=43131 RepID=UPI003DA3D811
MDRNKELLTPKEAAEILRVSTSTIRRWADDGSLPCCRVGKSGYRKFERDKVLDLKEKYYGNALSVSENLETERKSKIINRNIPAKSHPAHYLMHKYWGRKPHNVVNEYIQCFTKEGDTILDPFMGSGVTVIESVKLNRNVIGIDINPMSEFIVKNTISNVDLDVFSETYEEIIKEVYNQFSRLYYTHCPICNATSTMQTGVWDNNNLSRIRGICEEHGTFIKDANDYDLKQYQYCSELKIQLLEKQSIHYPTDDIMKYVKRSGRECIDELFSDRALIILSHIRDAFRKVEDIQIQNLLMFCFTSMLSNVSRMIPGDLEKATYKSGWVISKFWTPKIHTERNVFMCMDLRYKAVLKGKKELININESLADISVGDSSNLSKISDNSIDYIFTDPPYGESIAYLALSHFWNSWLQDDVNYENEIIIDPYRDKDYDDYNKRTNSAYKEFYRVLKPEHYMSFTFHNRDLNVWKAILDSCYEAGFTLENIILQEQAVSSGTQGINKKNTLTGDFVYNFKKTKRPNDILAFQGNDAEKFIKDNIEEFISKHNGATPTELYEYIIPIIVRNRAYTDKNGSVINIENILKSTYDYVKIDSKAKNKIGGAYKWVKK